MPQTTSLPNTLIFDIGSNATKASLVIDNRICMNWRMATQLGKKTQQDGSLLAQAIQRQIQAIEDILTQAEDITQCSRSEFLLQALGTEALRKAPNRDDLIQIFKDKFAIPLDIISGQREAELERKAILGTRAKKEHPNSRILSLDSGGSSTEYNCIDPDGRVIMHDSFPFGQHAIRSAIEHHQEMPYGDLFCALSEKAVPFCPEIIILAGSSFTTYATYALKIIPFDAQKVESQCILPGQAYPPEDLTAAAGSLMVSELANFFSVPMFVTTKGIRHGWLAENGYDISEF